MRLPVIAASITTTGTSMTDMVTSCGHSEGYGVLRGTIRG